MRILLVTPRFPYPTRTGDTLTVYHMLRHFSRRHEIDLVSCAGRMPSPEDVAAVTPFCRSVHTVPISRLRSVLNGSAGMLRGRPLQAGWFYSRKLARVVERLVGHARYDVLYAHTIRSARYLTDLQSDHRSLRVLAMQISMRLNYERLSRYERNPLYRLVFKHEAARLRTFEPHLVDRFDRTLIISDVDRSAIADGRMERFFACPHGVKLDDQPVRPEEREPNTIVFSGNMNYRPNVDAATFFCREIWPRVRAVVPQSVLFIVGANPDSSIIELSRDPQVEVTGEVPSIYAWLRRAAIGIDPLRAGAGLQNKVLEGMACGLPMVVTPVANEGVNAVPETHLLTADSAAAFADQVVRLLQNTALRRQLGEAARRFIEEHWTWDIHFNRLERLFAEELQAIRRVDHGSEIDNRHRPLSRPTKT